MRQYFSLVKLSDDKNNNTQAGVAIFIQDKIDFKLKT